MIIDDIERGIAELGSGYGSPELIGALRSGQLIRRLGLLNTLAREAENNCPDEMSRAQFREAHLELLAAHKVHPDITDEMLLYPNTGIWLADCIARVRSPESQAGAWLDLGYLGWLAAAVRVKIGIPSSMSILVSAGKLMLPSLGLARVPGPEISEMGTLRVLGRDSFEVQTRQALLKVADIRLRDADGWTPLTRVPVAGKTSFEVVIDDIDPFRNTRDPYFWREIGRHPEKLTAAQEKRWSELLAAAWPLMEADYPRYAEAISVGLRQIVPLAAEPVVMGASSTSLDAFGCIATTPPAGAHQMALTLIHEFQHAKLGALTDFVELYEEETERRFYAPWRDDPRPLGGLLQGIYAHLGITEFWRTDRLRRRDSRLAQVEFARWRAQVSRAIAEIRGSGLLTQHGLEFVEAAVGTLTPWLTEGVTDEAESIARETTCGHRVAWRVRNLQANPAHVSSLAQLWTSSGRAPKESPESELVLEGRNGPELKSRLLPSYLKILVEASRGSTQDAFGNSTAADFAYAEGDCEKALKLYVHEIEAAPALRPQPWAGLALTLQRLHSPREISSLLDRGEVVAQLHAQLRSSGTECDPARLALWLSGASAPC
jgi:HEXXH motif-containing protein